MLPIFIGGIIGPKGDAYKPEQALLADEAETFHEYQIEALAEAGVDYLMALTLPAISEAHGIARAMAATGLPYILSFVIRRDGTLLDGTPLDEAIESIDMGVGSPPVGYFVNCVHPTVLLEALMRDNAKERGVIRRLVGFHANTSTKRPEELDGLEQLETEEPQALAAHMMDVYKQWGIPILGGCCGTSTNHIECLARQHLNITHTG
jgi:homocysteine S-methyltransferase